MQAARETAYYQRQFGEMGIDPAQLTYEDLLRLPLTPKEARRSDPDAFVSRASNPAFRTTTTATTGQPASISLRTRSRLRRC